MFKIETERRPGQVCVVIGGEVDLATRQRLRDAGHGALEACADGETVVFDMTGVTFLDSTGVSALLELQTQAGRDGTPLEIVASPQVSRVLRLIGLDGQLPVVEDGDRPAAG